MDPKTAQLPEPPAPPGAENPQHKTLCEVCVWALELYGTMHKVMPNNVRSVDCGHPVGGLIAARTSCEAYFPQGGHT